MAASDEEEKLLRSVAIKNANSILLARQQAEHKLLAANEALERKTAELAHSLSMIRATLESTTDGILVTDEDGKVTDFNQQYTQMWSVPAEAMASAEHRLLLEIHGQQVRTPQQFFARIKEIYETAPPETFDVLEIVDGRTFERFTKIQFIGDQIGRAHV